MSAVRLDVRRFHYKDSSARELLETVGRTFLTGYGYAAESMSPREAEARLEMIPPRFRGFAYEGAGMAFAVRDALPWGRHDHVARFLDGRGGNHVYMVYVGVGWAMARLPRIVWSRLHAPDPLLRWLALDGYGFHQAFFRTRRYVYEGYRETRFPWPADGPDDYGVRVIDQGIGRACWFVGGADVKTVARLLDRFPESRHPDLYSGAGLAATYAGGVDEAELAWFWQHAGANQPRVAQGSAFAAGARVLADLVVPHNELATRIFCGMSVDDASKVTDVARPDMSVASHMPAYEIWRQQIADRLVPTTG